MKNTKNFNFYHTCILCILFFCNNNILFSQNITAKKITQNQSSLNFTDGILSGKLRVKLSESKCNSLQTLKPNLSTDASKNKFVTTGEETFDKALEKVKTHQLKRIFPEGGKFEEKHKKYGLDQWYELSFDTETSVDDALAEFSQLTNVLAVSKHYEPALLHNSKPKIVDINTKNKITNTLLESPNEEGFAYQWSYNNTGQELLSGNTGTVDADIDLLEAWGIQTGSNEVIVAIMDTGIEATHEDLAANMWINEAEIPDNGIDDDLNGYVDDVYGYNFADDSGNVIPTTNYHGTHVAGTVGAVTNNGIGVAGVAGGSGIGDGVKLMSCTIFGEEVSSGGQELAFVYAADHGAIISQNSWGNISEDPVLKAAVDYFVAEAGYDAEGNPYGPMQGGIVICASGNYGIDLPTYPANWDQSIAVGATDYNNDVAEYSSFGDWVDIAAPGSEILSTYIGNSYAYIDGTSMSTPHVSGVAALIISEFANNITPAEVRGRLEYSVTEYVSDIYIGKGILNAYNALQQNISYPKLSLDKDKDNIILALGEETNQGLTLTNDGEFDIDYSLSTRGGYTLTLPEEGPEYEDGFEEFSIGDDLSEYPKYYTDYDNDWIVSDISPYSGNNHLYCKSEVQTADDFVTSGVSAFIGQLSSGDYTFFNSKIKISSKGTTWFLELMNYNSSDAFITIIFDKSGSIYVSDNNFSYDDDNYTGFVPAGETPFNEYFDLTVAVDAQLNDMRVYINKNLIGIVESDLIPSVGGFEINSWMETDGVEFFMDDYKLYEGPLEAFQWISSETVSGNLAPGEQFTFDYSVTAADDLVLENLYSGAYVSLNTSASGYEDFEIPVSLYVTNKNLAKDGIATQSSDAYNGVASRAIDGNTDGLWSNGSVTHTQEEENPWWQVDLGSAQSIDKVVIYNRTDDCCTDRLSNFTVSVLDSEGNSTFSTIIESLSNNSITINTEGIVGNLVKIQLNNSGVLSLAEVEVYEYVAEEVSYFIPDPDKKYYIDIPAHELRLAATGESEDPYTTPQSSLGADVEWQFVAVGNYWHVQRAAGGSKPTLRTDNTEFADMQSITSTGVRTQFEFQEGYYNNSFYMTIPTTSSANKRVQILEDGSVKMVNDTETGEEVSFQFKEIIESSYYQAEDYDSRLGTTYETSTDTETNYSDDDLQITDVNDEDWIRYDLSGYLVRNGIEYEDVTHLSIRITSLYDAQIEVRDFSNTGDLLGTFDIPATGGWNNWETFTIEMEYPDIYYTGDRTLYFVFKGDTTENLLNFNWFQPLASKLASTEANLLTNVSEYESNIIELPQNNFYTNSYFTFYPNPVINTINVETNDELTLIKVFNLSGELLFETSNKEIDFSNYESGIYLIEAGGTIKKFVK